MKGHNLIYVGNLPNSVKLKAQQNIDIRCFNEMPICLFLQRMFLGILSMCWSQLALHNFILKQILHGLKDVSITAFDRCLGFTRL